MRAQLAASGRCAEGAALTITCDQKRATCGAAFYAAPDHLPSSVDTRHTDVNDPGRRLRSVFGAVQGRSRLCAGCAAHVEEEGRLTVAKSAVASRAMSQTNARLFDRSKRVRDRVHVRAQIVRMYGYTIGVRRRYGLLRHRPPGRRTARVKGGPPTLPDNGQRNAARPWCRSSCTLAVWK
jgi:hypothetical protein